MLNSEDKDDDAISIIVCYRKTADRTVVEGTTTDECFSCGREVWISPKSIEVRDQHDAKVSCLECAMEHATPMEGKSTDDLENSFREALAYEAEALDLGATGRFPKGKLNEHDQGELKTAIYVEKDKLVINFGKPITFVAMTKDEALMIAEGIRRKAMEIP